MIPIIFSTIESPEDHDMMVAFYQEYNLLMYHEARKHLEITEDIEDIVCEALTKIIEKMDVFRELARLQQVKYALTTVRNLAYILRKRKNYFTMVSFDELDYEFPADDSTFTEAVVEEKLKSKRIRSVLEKLDLDTRMLLEQKYMLKWKDAEVAEHMGIKPQSVRMYMTRARRALADELTRQDFHFSDWF